MRPRGEGEIVGLVFFALMALVIYGGWSLWQNHVAAPDDKCYWLAFNAGGPYDTKWLLDTPPGDGPCVKLSFAQAHYVKTSGNVDDLAEFTQKAGRRICGQSTTVCGEPAKK